MNESFALSQQPWAEAPLIDLGEARVEAPASVALGGSRFSSGSALRREHIVAARLARQQEEEARQRLEDEQLLQEDAASLVAGRLTVKSEPREERSQEQVIRSRILDLQEEASRLANMLDTTRLTSANVKQLSPSLSPSPARQLAQLSTKIKIPSPPKWKGAHVHGEVEGWIRSATGYFAGAGVGVEDDISEALSPTAYHLVRSLMSSEASRDQVSAIAWFDSAARRSPFSTLTQVFNAIRTHWDDPQAAYRTRHAFNSASQGSMRAREWGSHLESLANLVVDRVITDTQLMDRFTDGLSPRYAAHVALQTAALQRSHHVLTFPLLVSIASDLDSADLVSKKIVVSPIVTKAGAPAVKTSASSPTSAKIKWSDAAVAWQAENPMAKKDDWTIPNGKQAPDGLRCYNCGKVEHHYSRSCPNARVSPSVAARAIVAPVTKLSRSDSSSSPSATLSSVEESADPSGKVDGE